MFLGLFYESVQGLRISWYLWAKILGLNFQQNPNYLTQYKTLNRDLYKNCITSWVSFSITWPILRDSSWKSGEDGSLFPYFFKEFRLTVLGYFVSNNKISMCASSFGVDNSFGDSFSIKFGKFVKQVMVLDEEGAILACGKWVLIVVYGVSLWRCELWHGWLAK